MVGRFILIICVFFLIATQVSGQTVPEQHRFKFGVGFEYNQPIGKTSSEIYQNSFGSQIELRYGIQDELALTVSAGFIKVNTKAVEDDYLTYQLPDVEALPAKLGLLYRFNRFYAQAAGGPAFIFKPHGAVAMNFTPAVGFMFGSFDLSLKGEKWTSPHSMEYLGLQIRYYF